MLESLIDFSQLVRPKRPALSYVVLEIQNHSRESGHAMQINELTISAPFTIDCFSTWL